MYKAFDSTKHTCLFADCLQMCTINCTHLLRRPRHMTSHKNRPDLCIELLKEHLSYYYVTFIDILLCVVVI